MLKEAINRAKKQRNFKVGLKKASTVDDKNNLLRTAAFSMMVVSRPHLHKANSTAQTPHRVSTGPDPVSSSHRPRLQHLPYTSPLPSTELPQNLPSSHSEQKLPTSPSASNLSRKSMDASAPKEVPDAGTSSNAPRETPPLDTSATSPELPTETQPSTHAASMLKRRTTFGLRESKPGTDPTKLSLASIGKPNLAIGSKTLEIGKQGIDLTRQGLDFGKRG
ncbi:MAG: hypothetical protein Q9216_005199, partial [Gyalolechia sp. 2 TL-2023]